MRTQYPRHVEFIEYPVSGVLKLWHLALTAVGMSDIPAWTLSIALLVVTVRLILLPFAYRAYRSTRVLVNLRPAMAALDAEYADRFTSADRKELLARRRELQKAEGYRVRDGCVPALIQLPVFIGLYRFLLQVARPQDLEAASHSGIGALNSTEVSDFLQAEIFGIPLTAYVAMSDERFDFLGTTGSEVLRFALPLCIAAAIFTSANMAYSIYRNWMTLDENNATARVIFRMMFVLTGIAVSVPLLFGLLGPAPVAILCYWVMNNLWTMVQNVSLHVVLDRQVPYTEEFRTHRRAVGEGRKARRVEAKEAQAGLERRAASRDARISELDYTMNHSALEEVRQGAAAERDALLKEHADDKESVAQVVNREKLEKEKRKARQKEVMQAERAIRAKRRAEQKAAKAAGAEGPESAPTEETTEDTTTEAAGAAIPEDTPTEEIAEGVVEEAPAADQQAPTAEPAETTAPAEPAEPSGPSEPDEKPYRGRHRLAE